MSESEIRAATERLRRYYVSNVDVYLQRGSRGLSLFQDLETLYKAEHPADDNAPVDEEWVKKAGFECFDDKDIPGEPMVYWKLEMIIIAHMHIVPSLRMETPSGLFEVVETGLTRGDVRRLCRALGIELKEQDDANRS